VCLSPSLWLAAPVYAGVTLAARALSWLQSGARWERDDTSRTTATGAGS
jgi:hypothetical protein